MGDKLLCYVGGQLDLRRRSFNTRNRSQPAADGGTQSCFQQDNSEEFSI